MLIRMSKGCSFVLLCSFFPLVILLLTATEKGKLDINGLIYQGKKLGLPLTRCAHDEDALDFSLNFPSIFSFPIVSPLPSILLSYPRVVVFCLGDFCLLLFAFTPFLFNPFEVLSSNVPVQLELFGFLG